MSEQNKRIDLFEKLANLEKHIEALESRILKLELSSSSQIDDKMAVFLNVPDSIRKSLFAVSKLESCTADEVSSITTGRHRSIENKYLNELYRAGWLERNRKGKKIYYSMRNRSLAEKDEYWSAVEEVESKLDQLLG